MVKLLEEDENTAYSWAEASRRVHDEEYGEKIELPKEYAAELPRRFESSDRSIRGQANAVYRDQQKTDSIQVREYDDKWVLEVDRHNPETGKPLAHVIEDAPEYALGAFVVGAILFGASG